MNLPLNAVRVFAVVARCLSIKQAADGLCVTPGAVSRQIQALERHLGCPLFERRHRAIALTPAGLAFFERIAPALDDIAQAAQALRAAPRPVEVGIDATPTFAMHWLIPRLAALRAAHPDIALRLLTSQGPLRPSPDIALHIRREPRHFGGLAATAFLDEYALPVVSPALARELAAAPARLAGCPLIRMRSRPDLWPRWLAERPLAGTHPFIEFDNTILAIQAAGEGLGIALIPTLFLGTLLREGVLCPLPGASPLRSGSYHLLAGAGQSPAGQCFADWLRIEAAAESRRQRIDRAPAS